MSGRLLIAPQWLGRSGLWLVDAKDRRKPADPDDLGLSDALADRLESWMDTFDAIYDETDEAASDFADPAERAAWEAEGVALSAAIAAELGPDWQVDHDLATWRRTTT